MISQLKMSKWFVTSKMRFLTVTMPAGFLAAMVLTGCHHSAGGSSAVAPKGTVTMDAGGNLNYSGVAPAASTTVDGITVTYLSDKAINKELSTLPADVFPKDPGIGEKMAMHFFSSINSGDMAAAKSDVATDARGYLIKQGDPIGQIAYHVKADGRITDVTFMEFGPGKDHADFIGMMTFTDKKQMHFEITEFPKNQIEANEKQREEYASGKWYVMAVLDLTNNNTDQPHPL